MMPPPRRVWGALLCRRRPIYSKSPNRCHRARKQNRPRLALWRIQVYPRAHVALVRAYPRHQICVLALLQCGGWYTQSWRGPHPELHLIPVVLQVALGQRESITLFGGDYPTRDGTCVRDYVHIVDLAQAHILALDGIARLGSRKYNLGNGDGFTNLEVVEAARCITGHAIPCTIGARRPGDPAILIASAAKIRAELGWQPQYPNIDQIIGSAWEWHRTHPHGYRSGT